jgi:hypothetical protein
MGHATGDTITADDSDTAISKENDETGRSKSVGRRKKKSTLKVRHLQEGEDYILDTPWLFGTTTKLQLSDSHSSYVTTEEGGRFSSAERETDTEIFQASEMNQGTPFVDESSSWTMDKIPENKTTTLSKGRDLGAVIVRRGPRLFGYDFKRSDEGRESGEFIISVRGKGRKQGVKQGKNGKVGGNKGGMGPDHGWGSGKSGKSTKSGKGWKGWQGLGTRDRFIFLLRISFLLVNMKSLPTNFTF